MKNYVLTALGLLLFNFLDAQNVGIGTTSPTSKLEVVGKTKTTNLQLTTGAANMRILRSDATGNGIWTTLDSLGGWNTLGNAGTLPGPNFLGTLDSVDLIFKTDNWETGRFFANPLTGPGITTPTDRLRITRKGGISSKQGMSASFQLGSYATGTQSQAQLDLALSNTNVQADVKVMTLLGNGNVGIGNTTPHAALQFSDLLLKRKLVIYERENNNHQFQGIGRVGSYLVYQCDTTTSGHAFFAGVNASSSVELARITGTGTLAVGTQFPSASGILVLESTTKGMLMPRMSTSQRDAIANPATWLQIFNTDDGCTDIYDGSRWMKNCAMTEVSNILDPNHTSDNSWIPRSNAGADARTQAVGFSIGNTGYMCTGYNVASPGDDYFNDLWAFDPVSNIWTQKVDFPGTPRRQAVGFAINGKGYVGTGWSGSTSLNQFYEYDPETNAWTQKENYGGDKVYGAVGFSINGKGYVGTGTKSTGVQKDFWEYNPITDHWIQKADFGGVARTDAAGFSTNTKGYLGTGASGFDEYKDFWEYDPITNHWTQRANFPVLRRVAIGVGILLTGYLGTGFDSVGTSKKDFYEFNPIANSWKAVAEFPGSARGYAMGFSIGTKVYVGTGGVFGGGVSNDFYEYLGNTIIGHEFQMAEILGENLISDGAWTHSTNTPDIYTSSDGNVGIGVDNPNGRLQFSNAPNKRTIVLKETGNNDHQFMGFGYSEGTLFDNLYYQVDAVNSNHVFLAASGNSTSDELMRIQGNGRVGIGTNSPDNKLDLEGAIAIGASYSGTITAPANGAIIEGSVGIGTSSPMNKLDVEGGLAVGSSYSGTHAAPSNGAIIQGQLGIGIHNPDAPLHIRGTNVTTPNSGYTYFNDPVAILSHVVIGTVSDIGVHNEGWYWADGGGFVSTSDQRIKNIFGQSDSEHDLSILNQIKVTDYKYIDTLANSPILQKKVVAQQLREIYPSAVGQNAGVIPSVFELALSQTISADTTIIETGKSHGFVTGDEVKIIVEGTGELFLPVCVIDEHRFSVQQKITERIFVYGKKVKDLLNVDYDAISMLNVSATQELSKQIQILSASERRLTIENEKLSAENETANAAISVIASRLSDLEKKLDSVFNQVVINDKK